MRASVVECSVLPVVPRQREALVARGYRFDTAFGELIDAGYAIPDRLWFFFMHVNGARISVGGWRLHTRSAVR